MFLSRNVYKGVTGDLFSFTFDYLDQAHVKCLVDDVEVTFTFTGEKSIQLDAAITNQDLTIKRVTPNDNRLVDFAGGAIITEDNLDNSALQVFYIVQEAYDDLTAAVALNDDGSLSMNNKVINELAAAVNGDEAVNLDQMNALFASYQTAFDAAQTAAAGSATNAATSETNAAASAAAAATSATNAATSETNAATSASAAATSETNAATSETNAAASAASILGAEANSAASAVAAAGSATDAANSATAAAGAVSDAGAQAAIATTEANNAAASAAAAATSETNAATSETNAATSETNAAASAAAAAASAAAAGNAFGEASLGTLVTDPYTAAGPPYAAADINGQTVSKTFNGAASTFMAGVDPTTGARAKTSGLLVPAEAQNIQVTDAANGQVDMYFFDPVTGNGISVGRGASVTAGPPYTGYINIFTANAPDLGQRITVSYNDTLACGVDQDTGDLKAWVDGVPVTTGFLAAAGNGEGHMSAATDYALAAILTNNPNVETVMSIDLVSDVSKWNYSYGVGEDWEGNSLPVFANRPLTVEQAGGGGVYTDLIYLGLASPTDMPDTVVGALVVVTAGITFRLPDLANMDVGARVTIRMEDTHTHTSVNIITTNFAGFKQSNGDTSTSFPLYKGSHYDFIKIDNNTWYALPRVDDADQIIDVYDSKTNGTDGGATVLNTWTQRTLNTVGVNTLPGATLGSNQVTLPKGIYEVTVYAPFFRSDTTKIRLWSTWGYPLLYGSNAWCSDVGAYSGVHCVMHGRILMTASRAVSVQYFCEATQADGLGRASGDAGSGSEIYTRMIIKKIGELV